MKVSVFENTYLTVDDDGDKVFNTMPCPFLGEDNLISVVSTMSDQMRVAEFPHTDRNKIYQINHLTLKNTYFCSAAYLFVEKLQKRLEK